MWGKYGRKITALLQNNFSKVATPRHATPRQTYAY
jgi:hypothetical protein